MILAIADGLTSLGLAAARGMPLQPLPARNGNTVVRAGDLVIKHSTVAGAEAARAALATAASFGPAVVETAESHDLGVLVTRYVAGRNWERLLTSGRIDYRTFEKSGVILRRLHAVAPGFAHGAFRPDNVIVTPTGRLVITGWDLAGHNSSQRVDHAHFLAHLLADAVRRPFTWDWYVDAGRAFLAGYGPEHSAGLPERVAAQLLILARDARAAGEPEEVCAIRRLGLSLLDHQQQLPW